MAALRVLLTSICILLALNYIPQDANGAIPADTLGLINEANRQGPYLGIVIPNLFELDPLLQHPSYEPTNLTIEFSGRKFRFGVIEGEKVILINAGITTQLLLSFFDVKGVVHYGIAGNANPDLHIGDVTIAQYWSHLSLWSWQRFGHGPEDPLPLEAFGDYTREIGYLEISDYSTNTSHCNATVDNLLNNIWYQPEEIFPVDAIPEERQHVFWVPVDSVYYNLSATLLDMELENCLNSTTCLPTTPKVTKTKVLRGTSASIYLDNAAYRSFIYDKFEISPIDMESAAVALICYQQRVPFIAFRALSDLAGGGPAESNEADTFTPIAATNSVTVVVEFIKLLSGLKGSGVSAAY